MASTTKDKTETSINVGDCAICLEEMKRSWREFQPCQHCFCPGCSDKLCSMAKIRFLCPICRREITSQTEITTKTSITGQVELQRQQVPLQRQQSPEDRNQSFPSCLKRLFKEYKMAWITFLAIVTFGIVYAMFFIHQERKYYQNTDRYVLKPDDLPGLTKIQKYEENLERKHVVKEQRNRTKKGPTIQERYRQNLKRLLKELKDEGFLTYRIN